ncbi:MAG: hypothetical protein PHF25_08845 [Candidatus Margulisbacteria bacterium]|nr:hypothetical protein [Candidatus Margulisiibacteriota bacterium]
MLQIEGLVSLLSIIIAFMAALFAGLFAGIYPSKRASELDPAITLRYE